MKKVLILICILCNLFSISIFAQSLNDLQVKDFAELVKKIDQQKEEKRLEEADQIAEKVKLEKEQSDRERMRKKELIKHMDYSDHPKDNGSTKLMKFNEQTGNWE